MTTLPCSGQSLRDGIRRVLQNQWVVAVVIFVAAMAIHWGFHLYNPRANGFCIYHGSPTGDGCTYTFKAINIAKGNGIPPQQQPAIRPFYSIVLACVYTWIGFSLPAVVALNILIGGATAALIYLCGRLVFDPLYAFAAALFFAIDPAQLIQTPQPLTEPLGLLLFVGSVYAVMLAFKNWRVALFFLSGLLIGLSNLTRTLTLFALPFYLGLALLVGWRDRRLKAAGLGVLLMLLGSCAVLLPWIIRQERLYGIASISDNIGEAIYAATSPDYKKWTPAVRNDADAAGIPNTIGDRYRYFIDRAIGNMKANPSFYLRNVGGALWEYANTFGSRSRATNRYVEWYSRAAESQDVLLVYLLISTLVICLLHKGSPWAVPNVIFLISSIGLIGVYRLLPAWATFFPVCLGIICSWRAGPRVPVLILSGSLATAVLGSAIFANPALFRTILMTDWLFLFFFLAAIWLPAGIISRKFARSGSVSFSGEEEIGSVFQKALSSISVRFLMLFLIILLGFFAVSSVRLVILTVSESGKKNRTQFSPGWDAKSVGIKLTTSEKMSLLRRFQGPPFSILPEDPGSLSVYAGGKEPLKTGEYIVTIQGFYYDYYIPPQELPRHWSLAPKPYARTFIIAPRFDFIIAGEIPSNFAGKPVIFVGLVVPQDNTARQRTERPQVQGLALIPLTKKGQPDFAHAICAPPSI